SYVASVVVLLPATVSLMLYILPRTSIGRQVLLEGPNLEEVTPYVRERERLEKLIGKTGQTITLVSPGGLVRIDGERLHCESRGMLIEPGEDVEVVAVKGNRVVVQPAAPRSASEDEIEITPAALLPDDEEDADESPLDFDVPQR
ncbi:MAG: NfeD family protein, partial [Planctomycetaceae bacterium]